MSEPRSDNPLLGKADALMQKHRGQTEAKPEAAASAAWLPVLTEVVTRGTPPPSAPLNPAASTADTPNAADAPATPDAQSAADAQAEQLLKELAPRLSEAMEKQVATELRKNLDQTVATLLSQLDVNVREIVRDAVAEKLKAHKPDA